MTDEPTPDTAETTDPSAVAIATPDGEQAEKLKQTVELKDIGPCKKHIKASIDRAEIDKRLHKKYSTLVKEAVIPGFRPGKAPRQVVTKRFEKEVVGEVRGQVLMASLEQLAEEMAGRLKLVNVNVDESPQLQQRFGVQAIPTLMVLRDGQVAARKTGAAPAPALRTWLTEALAS